MKAIKVRNALICEHAVPGARNKYTLINVYAGDIIVGQFPATFPLAFYIEMETWFSTTTQITLGVMINDKKRVEILVELEPQTSTSKAGLLLLPPLQYTFEENSTIKIVATGSGIKRSVLLERSVTLGVLPN